MAPIHHLLLAAGLLLPFALPAHSEEHRAHDAHVHGAATLTLVLEGKIAEIELESPAMNITGFEHAPRTAEQRRQVEEAQSRLQQAGSLIQLDGCTERSSDVHSTLESAPAAAAENADHHDHDHDHETHAEFSAHYQLDCPNISAIDKLTVTAFNHFPGFETVQVQWVSPRGQGAATATRTQPVVKLE